MALWKTQRLVGRLEDGRKEAEIVCSIGTHVDCIREKNIRAFEGIEKEFAYLRNSRVALFSFLHSLSS